MDKSPAFLKSLKDVETTKFLNSKTNSSAKTLRYKLNKEQTFTLIDGVNWPSLFLKMDDTPIDEDVCTVNDVKS